MGGTFSMVLAVLVWRKLIPMHTAKVLEFRLGSSKIPPTIEEIIVELEQADKIAQEARERMKKSNVRK